MRNHLSRLAILIPMFLVACAPTPSETESVVESELTISAGIVRQDIDLWTPAGTVHTAAVYELGARLRPNRRVILLVPGTLANGGAYYDIDRGGGFDAAEILARAGFIVGIVDLPGTGLSYRPANGADADSVLGASAVARAALAYRIRFLVPTVDVYGETGVGGNVALLMARNSYVRSVVITAPAYLQFGPATAPTLFNPAFYAGLDMIPDGYLPQDPAFIGFFLSTSDPSIVAEAVPAIVGPSPATLGVAPYFELRDHGALGPSGAMLRLASPIAAAEPARAPAFIVGSDPDFIGDPGGTLELADAYGATGGGDAEVLILDGASHIMRFDTLADGASSVFWSAVLDYLAAH